MPRLWAFCLLLASAKAMPRSAQVNRTCPYQEECDASINLRHIEKLEGYVNMEVDPCEDFHGYACGNWNNIHGQQDSAMSLSGDHINQQYENLFENLLRNRAAEEHGMPIYPNLVKYYHSCKVVNKPRLRRYLELLPAPTSSHWLDLVALLGRYGYHEHFVKIEVSQHNASHHMILIQPHNYNLNWNFTMHIYKVLRRHLQNEEHLLHFQDLREKFLELEQNLLRLAKPAVEADNLKVYTLEGLQREIPEVNWARTLGKQMGRLIHQDHQLLIDELPAIRNVINYLNEADGNLLKLYSLARFLNYLTQLPHNPLEKSEVSSSSRSSVCVRHMRKALYLAMNYAYETSFYHKQRSADDLVIHKVFEELKAEFTNTLNRNEFGLNPTLLSALKAKVEGVRLNVGNMPRNVPDDFYLDFDQSWIVGRDFYENHLHSLLHFNAHLSHLETMRNGLEKHIWYSFNYHGPELMDNIDATPYFYCLSSIIIIPYAYVQLPFYHYQFWPALLYGDLANTLGHEMLHAFDTYFVDYDAQGNMRDYSDELLLNPLYNASVHCLNDSSVESLNERTSDISGSRLALQTYMKDPQQRLANGRLYFLQFAQFFCGEKGDIFHDVGSKRLNYALAQMPEFVEVFHCEPGQAMNPTERCSFW
ncbi:endothelin-converting enzyme-like 1 [Drosophila tropicalis]|uniref:endothelin-converting enzyme-like 1 n=1 Tax=Drosophila tropicalis TaxID=46794 RepID=UPI0035ABB330